MEFSPFIEGIIIGLTLAVPVGPISLICIQRAIDGGRLHGIVSGIGVATADTLYAAVAVLGLTFISGLILVHQVFFRAIAGIVLIVVGIKVFLSVPEEPAGAHHHISYTRDYLSLLAIALANPLTILFFIIVLPGFGIVLGGSSLPASLEFILGIFCGSVTWWVILCGAVGSVRSRLSISNLRFINHISGILIVCFGIGTLLLFLVHPQT
jgi:threonine/homoserine/homoserine lactone efflux protein